MNNAEVEEQMYATIGRAVCACQSYELTFTMCVRLVFRHPGATTVASIQPLDVSDFLPSMRSLLTELKKYVPVSPEFEKGFMEVMERRNILVHRWFAKYGWPTSEDLGGMMKLTKVSLQLTKDASSVSKRLMQYVRDWMGKISENAPHMDRINELQEGLKAIPPFPPLH